MYENSNENEKIFIQETKIQVLNKKKSYREICSFQ